MVVDERDALQERAAPAREMARARARELGAVRAEERQLIDLAGTLGQEEGGRVRVLEHEGEIIGGAQWIDRDERCAELRRKRGTWRRALRSS